MPLLDDNCNASNTLNTSAKFLPTVIGYVIESFNFLSGPIMNTDLTVAVSFGVLPSGKYASLGCLSPVKLCHNSDPPYLSNYGTVLRG